jgi:hypothetical protein
MGEFLSKFNGGELIGLVSVLGGLLIAVLAVVVSQWRRVRVTELEAALKQQMLERGMSAAEIEQVVRATREKPECGPPVAFSGETASDKAALVKLMTHNGYSGEDIEKVLGAFAAGAERRGASEKASREKAAAAGSMVKNGADADDIARMLHAFDDTTVP